MVRPILQANGPRAETRTTDGTALITQADLANNAEFLAYGNVFSAGLNFMIDNIENPMAIKQILSTKDASKYFMPGVSIRQQLEVTFFFNLF